MPLRCSATRRLPAPATAPRSTPTSPLGPTKRPGFDPLRRDLGETLGALAAVPQSHRDDAVVLAGLDQHRQFQTRGFAVSAATVNAYHVAILQP